MGRKYRNPPVKEAVCEFEFHLKEGVDPTIPGLLYDRIQKSFGDKKLVHGIRKEVRVAKTRMEEISEIVPRAVFRSKDKKFLVQVGENFISVHHLQPYTSWRRFEPHIVKVFNEYRRIAKPKTLKKVRLRYFNVIGLKARKEVNETQYFNFYPHLPQGTPHSYFIREVSVDFHYEPDVLLVTFGQMPSRRSRSGINVVLELTYIMTQGVELKSFKFGRWLQQAHSRVEKAFEACITQRCRKMFEELKTK